MIVPGSVISAVTFPGVIVHEMGHQIFCRLSRVAVLDVCYFRFGNPAGYVVHETPSREGQQILIGLGPFFVNSLLGTLVAFPAAIPVLQFDSGSPLDYALIWLGISIAMHSFPSSGDAKTIWKAVWGKGTSIWLRIVATPIVGIIYAGALGSVIWLDVAYGYFLAMALPSLLIGLFA